MEKPLAVVDFISSNSLVYIVLRAYKIGSKFFFFILWGVDCNSAFIYTHNSYVVKFSGCAYFFHTILEKIEKLRVFALISRIR